MKRIILSLFLISVASSFAIADRTLSSNEIWSGTHVESDNVIVPNGFTLTISAGTTVRFASGKSLKITGTGILHAGNSDASGSSILFTADNGTSWGHIFCESTAISWIKNCEIEKGSTTGLTTDFGSVYGGGLYARTSSLTIEKCLVHNCSATWGGGIFIGSSVSPVLKTTKIYSNTASSGGGGLYIWQNSASLITNCIIYNNNCTGFTYGGGGVMLGYGTGAAKLINCVIANNTSGNNGKGIYFYTCPNARIINTAIWGNGAGTQIYFDASTPTSVMQYCGIQGVSYSTCINLSNNNADATGPHFKDPSGYDYSIYYPSPLRDAGTSGSAPATDFLYNPRISTIDIGAFELQYSLWTGATSNLWSTASNWTSSVDPSTGSGDVFIPSGKTNYPTGSSPDFTLGSSRVMIIDPGGRLSLNSLTNNGSLYLNASSSGFASLILNNYTRGSGGAEFIQLFLAGGGNEDDDNFKWHYISTPVTSLAASTFAPGATLDLAQYVESRPSLSLLQGWVAYDGYVYSTGVSNGPTFSTLNPGKGYDFWDSVDNTFTFSGLFNAADVAVSLPYSGNPTLSGFNLLGNPFVSGLDWNAIVNGTYFTYPSNTSKGLYFSRDNVQCSYIAGVGIPGDVNGIIPPMQGFFTKTNSTGNTITLAAAARTNTGIHATYKGSETIPLVRLSLSNGSVSYDETVVRFDEAAKSTLDNDFDAIKMIPSTTQNQIYTEYEGTKFAINGLPFPDANAVIEIPVVLNLTTAGNYQISITQFQALGSLDVGLKDNTTGATINLCNTLKFTFSSEAGTISDRFILRIGDIWTGVEEISKSKSQFSLYEFDNSINIVPLTDDWAGKKVSVNIIDLSGRYISNNSNLDLVSNSVISVPAPSAKGLYLVEIKSGLNRYVGKVIIR
jgi:hypothetical protein